MEEADDEDLKIQRASLRAIALMKESIPRLLQDFDRERRLSTLKGRSEAEVRVLLGLLDIFQEEPQLLDPHLKAILPPLADRCAQLIVSYSQVHVDLTVEKQIHGIADILYTLCKVRGEKVVVRFFDNQPKFILPVIDALKFYSGGKDETEPAVAIGDVTQHATLSLDSSHWRLRYILLLWAGHLVLTPFDLSSIAEGVDTLEVRTGNLSLPGLPSIAKSLAEIALDFLNSPSKEQSSAASMLVKLVLRPDMLKTKVVDSLVAWSLELLSTESVVQANIHSYTFALQFLYGVLRSANVQDIGHQLPSIFNTIIRRFGVGQDNQPSSVQQSAVARKLAIKILRSVTIHLLQSINIGDVALRVISERMIDQSGALEDTVEFFLNGLADRDTQVRYAASKALSILTTKLERGMGEEVVEAIIGSLGEDVRTDGNVKDLSSVNPLRWHGLTLTLSHMLFRRSPSPDQLDDILKALYLTLTFEQRSTTGNSLGTNVRDAANFGLWSLARRYTTTELLGGSAELTATATGDKIIVSKIQRVANNLLISACLDPSGNVRRGSSAALQELIGRHPDEIKHGISLVQIVDYQAVGLRRRAMVDVAFKASNLDDLYRTELLGSLFGWRGLESPDVGSRNYAALSLAKLASCLPKTQFDACLNKVTLRLRSMPVKDVEHRHGLTKALSELVLQQACTEESSFTSGPRTQFAVEPGNVVSKKIMRLWSIFDAELKISPQEVNTTSARSGLNTESIVSLLYALALYTRRSMPNSEDSAEQEYFVPPTAALTTMNLCLKSLDESTLAAIPLACEAVCLLLPPGNRSNLVNLWLSKLVSSSKTQRRSGLMLAIASARCTLRHGSDQSIMIEEAQALEEQILVILVNIFDDGDIEARVMAIRCLTIVADAVVHRAAEEPLDVKLLGAFSRALNDYTTNERGDVGSLVRLEAIEGLRCIWSARPNIANEPAMQCRFAIQRLALERLDKVRLQAARCLRLCDHRLMSKNFDSLSDISTHDYFFDTALSMITAPKNLSSETKTLTLQENNLYALIEGFASSTTGGSDSLIPIAQSALFTLLDALPTHPTPTRPHSPSFLDIANTLLALLRETQGTDRTLTPLLEMTVFLFDAGLLARLPASSPGAAAAAGAFKFRTLLSLVQKSHFKSSSLPKLFACLHLYRHLAAVPTIRTEALRKLTSMLGHPFPKVRVAAAEALWAFAATDGDVDDGAGLAERDWSGVGVKEGKMFGEELARRWGVV